MGTLIGLTLHQPARLKADNTLLLLRSESSVYLGQFRQRGASQHLKFGELLLSLLA